MKDNSEQIPRIGIGTFLINKNWQILLGKRKGSHGAGEWSLPGGHLEWMEKIEDCSRREVKEETGLVDIEFLTELGFSQNFFPKDKKHYITIYTAFYVKSGEPKLIEPNKCEGWEWFDLFGATMIKPGKLPLPLFGGIDGQMDAVRFAATCRRMSKRGEK